MAWWMFRAAITSAVVCLDDRLARHAPFEHHFLHTRVIILAAFVKKERWRLMNFDVLCGDAL